VITGRLKRAVLGQRVLMTNRSNARPWVPFEKTPETEPTTRDRTLAAPLAGAFGDARGWPMDNRANRVGGTAKVDPSPRLVSWRRREVGGFAPPEQEIAAGTHFDDTQLFLAVARRLSSSLT
jgi:hypothetical protein